jgi:hypothetical protein
MMGVYEAVAYAGENGVNDEVARSLLDTHLLEELIEIGILANKSLKALPIHCLHLALHLDLV